MLRLPCAVLQARRSLGIPLAPSSVVVVPTRVAGQCMDSQLGKTVVLLWTTSRGVGRVPRVELGALLGVSGPVATSCEGVLPCWLERLVTQSVFDYPGCRI